MKDAILGLQQRNHELRKELSLAKRTIKKLSKHETERFYMVKKVRKETVKEIFEEIERFFPRWMHELCSCKDCKTWDNLKEKYKKNDN
jgi:hypothetical protein